jgi:hypothetical protein
MRSGASDKAPAFVGCALNMISAKRYSIANTLPVARAAGLRTLCRAGGSENPPSVTHDTRLNVAYRPLMLPTVRLARDEHVAT